jgi:hypothetical protein
MKTWMVETNSQANSAWRVPRDTGVPPVPVAFKVERLAAGESTPSLSAPWA